MTDETEALRKRVEELEKEVNGLRRGYTSQNVYDGVRPMAKNEAAGHVARMRGQVEVRFFPSDGPKSARITWTSDKPLTGDNSMTARTHLPE